MASLLKLTLAIMNLKYRFMIPNTASTRPCPLFSATVRAYSIGALSVILRPKRKIRHTRSRTSSTEYFAMPSNSEPTRAKVFHKNSIAVSALSGCISSRLCTKTRLFELQKRAVLPLKHHFLRRADRSLNGASDRPLHEIEAGEGFWGRLWPGAVRVNLA